MQLLNSIVMFNDVIYKCVHFINNNSNYIKTK